MRPKKIIIYKSPNKTKKLRAEIHYEDGRIKNVDFGASGYSDYTIHNDIARRQRYDSRHNSNENWGITGIETAGFWAKWILWNKPTLRGSITDTKNKFNLKIKLDLK